MSIASEKNRIEDARNRIRSKLVSLGVANGTENIEECATIIEGLNLSNDLLSKITITPPYKKTYLQGETLNLAGVYVEATYGGIRDVTSKAVFEPPAGYQLNSIGDFDVDVSYTEGGVLKQGGFVIRVNKALVSISVTKPTKDSYYYGEALNLSGLVVTATYSDGSTEDVTSMATISPQNGHTLDSTGTTTINVSYTENGITKTASTNVNVRGVLQSISMTEPTKKTYNVGESLNLSGVVVTATYSDGSTANVTNSTTFSPNNNATLSTHGTTTITATYTENNVTKTTTTTVTVNRVLQTISVTAPTKSTYTYGEQLNLSGSVVTATFNDGTTQNVTSSATFTPANGSTLNSSGNQTITASYTYNGVTKTATTSVTVNVVLSHISVSKPTKSSYEFGEALNLSGATVTAHYNDGSTNNVTQQSTFYPENGAALDSYGDGNVTITATYTSNNVVKTATNTISISLGMAKPCLVYVNDNDEIQYAKINNISELCGGSSSEFGYFTIDSKTVYKYMVKAVFLEGLTGYTSIPNNFCYMYVNLVHMSGISQEVTEIGAGFLSGCKSFNQHLSFNDGVSIAGYNFMAGCRAFNHPIAIPNIMFNEVRDYFMSGCKSFNQPLTLPSNTVSIKNSFLLGCDSFNSVITIPNSVTSIGNDFLKDCKSYNKPITISSSITSISDNFMMGCDNMTSTITINCSESALKARMQYDRTLTTTNPDAPMYTEGVPISGSLASVFVNKFGTTTSSPYRKTYLA